MEGMRKAPFKAKVAYSMLCVSAFLMYGVNNILMSIAPSYVIDLGLNMAAAGAQGTIFLMAAIIIRLACTPLFTRFGTKPFLAIGGLSFVLALFAMIAFPTFIGFVLARVVQAIGLAVFWPCASSMIMEIAPKERSGIYLGTFRLVTKISLTIGPALAFEFSDSAGYKGVFAGLIGACLIATCLNMAPWQTETLKASSEGNRKGNSGTKKTIATDEEEASSAEEANTGESRNNLTVVQKGSAALILFTTILTSLSYGLIMNFSATFIKAYYPEANEGIFLTIFSIGCIIANPLFGATVDKIPWRKLLVVGVSTLSLGIALLALSSEFDFLLMPSGIIAGLGSAGSTVCLLQGIAHTADDTTRAELVSHQQNCVDISIAISSSLFGVLLSLPIEYNLVYEGWAIVSLLLPLLGIVIIRRHRENVPAKRK